MRRTLFRVGIWAAGIVGALLLGLGVNSAVHHIENWVSPPPPPLADQIDQIVHGEALEGWTLQYQTVSRLHPGGDLSYIQVFAPSNPIVASQRTWELRIYDLHRGRLSLAYRLRPIWRPAESKIPYTFGITVLAAGVISQNGTAQIVATLDGHSADSVPTVPVVISWDARRDVYTIRSVLTKAARPNLHGQAIWRRGYRLAFRIVNSLDRTQRLFSYWAEAVELEHTRRASVIVGLFYARAKYRANPTTFELNIWPLSPTLGPPRCQLGRHAMPIFVAARGSFSSDQLMSSEWQLIRTRVLCY
jgi:hypothetical protein